jgi:glutaredoxin
MIKLFFKSVRVVLGPFMLLWEQVTRPTALVRQPLLQAGIDQQCLDLVLYQYATCPFCIKVRQEMRRLSLPIERRDAQKNDANRLALIDGCGKAKVPCLKITDAAGNSQWMTDSKAIIGYLRGRFATA